MCIARRSAMRNFVASLATCLTLSLAATGCIIESDDDDPIDATLLVDNQSDYAIVELYLTDVGSSSWGPNLLGGDILLPDETITLGVECGFYDALLVDEDDVECEINDLDLCLNDADWVIRNNTCAVFGAAKQAREEARQQTIPAADVLL